jgi:hypothetical protein
VPGPAARSATFTMSVRWNRRQRPGWPVTPTLLGAITTADGDVLHLGRTRRLVSKAQRRALTIRDRMCRVDSERRFADGWLLRALGTLYPPQYSWANLSTPDSTRSRSPTATLLLGRDR